MKDVGAFDGGKISGVRNGGGRVLITIHDLVAADGFSTRCAAEEHGQLSNSPSVIRVGVCLPLR